MGLFGGSYDDNQVSGRIRCTIIKPEFFMKDPEFDEKDQ